MFLHFFDQHFLEERNLVGGRARTEMELAVRFAVMIATTIFVPAASWFESPLARKVLTPFIAAWPDLFVFAGSGASPDAFRAEKLEQYALGSSQGRLYRDEGGEPPTAWRRRRRSATTDIAEDWRAALQAGAAEPILQRMLKAGARGAEAIFEKLPERLEGQAFIADNVAPILGLSGDYLGRQNLHELINPAYFRSYGRDFKAAVFQNMILLGADDVGSGDPDRDIDFRELHRICGEELIAAIRTCPPGELLQLAGTDAFQQAFSFSQTSRPPPEPMKDKPLTIRAIEGPLAVDLAIVVALPKEREAVQAVFGRGIAYRAPDDPMLYQRVELMIGDRLCRVIIATLSEMGNASAAVAATNIARSFDARRLAMIGIAGGCPNPDPKHLQDHVRLGDVVIASHILEWDLQKRTSGNIEYRGTPHDITHDWMQAVRALQNEAHSFDLEWVKLWRAGLRRQHIKAPDVSVDILHDHAGQVIAHPADPRRRQGRRLVHLGIIGAGDTLLKDPTVRDLLRDARGVRAVEMESSGIRAAGWAHNGSFVTVRGVVDYCDAHKTDDWHRSAATAAAAVTYLMFQTLVMSESTARREV